MTQRTVNEAKAPNKDSPPRHRIDWRTAAFGNKDEENLFRMDVWPEWTRQLHISLVLMTVINLLWIYVDYLALGPTRGFWGLLAGRLGLTIVVITVIVLTRRERAPRTADLGALLFVWIQVVVGCGAMILKQEPAPMYATAGVMVALFFYIFIPNRFLWTLGSTLSASVIFVASASIASNPTHRELASMIILIIVCNLAGAATTYRAHKLQRMRFASVVHERATRAQIEHESATKDKAISTAQEAVRAKNHFIAAASHDLRQPTQALMLFSAALQQNDLGDAVNKTVAGIVQSGNTLQQLLNALLDISRLESGMIEPDQKNFCLSELIARLSTETAPQTEEKGLRLQSFIPDSIMVKTDPGLLERVLRNILMNAISYTHRGGILIGCRRRNGKIRIEVWDTGEGIAEDEQTKVFDDFFQVNNPERGLSKGLGLGLSNVRRISDLLGLPVSVRSRIAKGSVFSIDVPIEQSTQVNEKKTAAAIPTLETEGLSIILIDDDTKILESFKVLAEQWGHQVFVAESEAAANQALDHVIARPDLIISDFRLPGGRTGIQAITALRERLGDDTRAAILTGDTAPGLMQQIYDAGLDILHKPLDAQKFADFIVDPSKTSAHL